MNKNETAMCYVRNGADEGIWIHIFDFTRKKNFIAYCCIQLKCTANELKFTDWMGIVPQFEAETAHKLSAKLWELSELDNKEMEALEVYCERFGNDLKTNNVSQIIREMLGNYDGHWQSEVEFAENILDECYNIDNNIKVYFDYGQFAEDLFRCDYWYDDRYGCVFRG